MLKKNLEWSQETDKRKPSSRWQQITDNNAKDKTYNVEKDVARNFIESEAYQDESDEYIPEFNVKSSRESEQLFGKIKLKYCLWR